MTQPVGAQPTGKVYPLSTRQRDYARRILQVGRGQFGELLGPNAAVLAIACSGAEASLTNWENSGSSTLTPKGGRALTDADRATARQSLGLGDGVPPWGDNLDSMGLFAQRPMMGWGTPAHLMNPEYAAGKFYERLAAIPDWQAQPAESVIRKVQGYYADVYTPWLATAWAFIYS